MVFKDWHQKYFTKDPKKRRDSLRPQLWKLLFFSSFLVLELQFALCRVLLGSVALSWCQLCAQAALCDTAHSWCPVLPTCPNPACQHRGNVWGQPDLPRRANWEPVTHWAVARAAFHLSWISPAKTWNKCSIPWDKPAWGMAQLGLQHFGANSQWMGCVHSQALSFEGCSIVLLCCWTWKLPGFFSTNLTFWEQRPGWFFLSFLLLTFSI